MKTSLRSDEIRQGRMKSLAAVNVYVRGRDRETGYRRKKRCPRKFRTALSVYGFYESESIAP